MPKGYYCAFSEANEKEYNNVLNDIVNDDSTYEKNENR